MPDLKYTEEELEARINERLAEQQGELAKMFGGQPPTPVAIRQLWDEAKRAKAKLKEYDGVDPDEHRRLKQAAEDAERKKAAAEGDFKAVEKQLIERHSAEMKLRDAKEAKLTKSLERRLVDAELTRAIASKKGDPDLLLPFARQFVRVKELDDDFVGYIADANGNPRLADGKGTPMDFDSFVVQELIPRFPKAFEGTGSAGGGAPKPNAGGGGPKVIAAGDNKAFIDNVVDIASGKVTVDGT